MSKKRRKDEEADARREQMIAEGWNCTTLDHLYPSNPGPDTKCYCGKKTWRPFIVLDDYLKPGDLIRTYDKGLIYRVEMVNESRARCRLVPRQQLMSRRAADLVIEQPAESTDEAEQRGHIINISSRSTVSRVTLAELQEELTPTRSSDTMANKNFAGTPVANKSVKDRNADRLAKLAQKPKSTARPLTGAAAKAKANANGRPKTPKTVRECGCGCGGETMSYFIPGHDARFKGWMKKIGDGRMTLDELKAAMGKKTFGKYAFKKQGAGFVTKTTYQEAAEA